MKELTMKAGLWKGQLLGLLFVGLLAGGCARVVNVIASDEICTKSVEVHLVGVNRFETDTWDSISMTEYWQPGNQRRKDAENYTYVIQFGQGPCKETLSKKDPIRRVWKSRKAEYLYVLADLPGLFTDQPGDADPRRLRLPAVNSKRWGRTKTQISIRIEGSNIVPLTMPK
jgi:hypothetical protein